MPRPAPSRRPSSPSHTSSRSHATPRPKQAPQPITPKKLNTFLHHLGRTGSITFAATRAGLPRRALYKLRAADPAFAGRWKEALHLGMERLQDDAMRRALNGTERAVIRNGQKVGSVQQFDNRLLQFLLRAHRPETYGDKARPAFGPPPFDLIKRMAAAEARMKRHEEEERLEALKKQSRGGGKG